MRRKACSIVGAVFLACTLTSPALGEDSVKEDEALNLKVLKLYQAGKYGEALPLAQQALEVQEKVLGPEHPDAVLSVFILAMLYRATGQYAKAEPLFQRTLPFWEKGLGSEHPLVVTNLNHLAGLYADTGQYAKAELLYQRTLAIAEKAVGPEHPDVTMNLLNLAVSLQSLAMLYATTGQYAKAEPLYQRSLAIHEKALGLEHSGLAQSLNGLANLYLTIGQYAKAEPLYQRSLAIREKALGPEHPDTAQSLNNLAWLYRITYQSSKAQPLIERSLAILEKSLGPGHPDVATNLNDLALLYADAGEYAKAEPLLQRSLAIREKALGPEHSAVGQSLHNLAAAYRFTGQYAKAEPLYQRSLAIVEKALGTEHPDVAVSLDNLAMLAAAQHDYFKAKRLFTRSLHIQDRQIQEIFAFTTEEQKLQFMQKIMWTHLEYLSLIHQYLSGDPDTGRDGLETVLRRKGVVFDAQSRMREAIHRELSGNARIEWEKVSSLRRELSQVVLNKPQNMTADQYRDRLVALQQQIEHREQRIASESAMLAKSLEQRNTTVAAISKTLPKQAALVEFVLVPNVRFGNEHWTPSWRYLAFTLSASGVVSMLDLGDMDSLNGLVQRTLQAIKLSMDVSGLTVGFTGPDRTSSDQGSEQSLKELFARVWAPLEPALGNADKVILSPDSLLNLVPFAALLDGKGRAVVERYRLAYVSSGRDLVGSGRPAVKSDSALLLVANPAFDGTLDASNSPEVALRARDFRGVFPPLPGTAREAQDIPPLVTESGGSQLVLEGIQATEHAVKSSRNPRIVHLATHGFFLPDEALAAGDGTRGVTIGPGEKPVLNSRYENPLVRSGLAFAGANNASAITEGDDGILTASEVTGMDLQGTELVVLSACDTGVGAVKVGEGVFGLRRAFALAGARNLLMSLWPVSDEVTANQMKSFYKNLQTLPPAEALRQAQLETIKELKTKNHGVAPPGLWAPFILQGAQALGR